MHTKSSKATQKKTPNHPPCSIKIVLATNNSPPVTPTVQPAQFQHRTDLQHPNKDQIGLPNKHNLVSKPDKAPASHPKAKVSFTRVFTQQPTTLNLCSIKDQQQDNRHDASQAARMHKDITPQRAKEMQCRAGFTSWYGVGASIIRYTGCIVALGDVGRWLYLMEKRVSLEMLDLYRELQPDCSPGCSC
ncbi:hypothetical protein Nepgr_033901 [Nepenthes gracilis]|uniref:Uncharacterized protein n=1 Tax=Nepenthes gracilis TaxID=150966 RepID=A0AAD3TN50_NEPGR|nr:hypothetical protein Nepgr_033901 [Nepenthes gracilis]